MFGEIGILLSEKIGMFGGGVFIDEILVDLAYRGMCLDTPSSVFDFQDLSVLVDKNGRIHMIFWENNF